MLRFFNRDSASSPPNNRTISSDSVDPFPGGPSPDTPPKSKHQPQSASNIAEPVPAMNGIPTETTHADKAAPVAEHSAPVPKAAADAPTTDTNTAVTSSPGSQAPRSVDHINENTINSKSQTDAGADVRRQPFVAVGGRTAPSPPPRDKAVSPVMNQGGKAMDSPQHPAVAGAGAGIGVPAETAPAHPPLTNKESTHFAPDTKESVDAPARNTSPKPILRNGTITSNTSSHARTASGAGRATSPKPASTATHGSPSADNPTGSTFANGAATAAPFSDVDDTVHERRATAGEGISAKDEVKIDKQDKKHNRTLSKVIRGEALAEKQALEVALKELGELQKLQKAAVKEESICHTTHAKALSEEHKKDMAFLSARNAHDLAMTTRQAAEEALEASRQHARSTTEMLRLKAEEVEHLRVVKGADDRERAVKVRELSGDDKRGISRFFGH